MENVRIQIANSPKLAIEMLIKAGFEAGIVGGCVRDSILGIIPHDWDICTAATPNEIQTVFKDFKQVDIGGLRHGTVIVIINGEEIEITTYRVDGEYSDGRRPDSVSFSQNLIEDLKRRDYTMNAIFYNDYIGIVDPFNGVYDIKNKIIKCVGNPNKRFQEDSLRILRGMRFSSKFGFEVEKETKAAMFSNKELLKNISSERISKEFYQIFQGVKVTEILKEFQEIIILILPEIKDIIDFKQNNPYHIYDVWNHTLTSIDNAPTPQLKLTMLFHDIAKPSCYSIDENGIGHFYDHPKRSSEIATKVFKRIKISAYIEKEELNEILALIEYHNYSLGGKHSVKRLLNKIGERTFRKLLLVKKADILAQNPKFISRLKDLEIAENILNEIIIKEECFSLKDLKINGKILIEKLGLKPGKEIGFILNKLLEMVLDIPSMNDEKTLILEAEKIIRSI